MLHLREKDSDDQALQVSFVDGHWEFLGYDTDVKLSQGRQAILELFEEKEQALSIDEILKWSTTIRNAGGNFIVVRH